MLRLHTHDNLHKVQDERRVMDAAYYFVNLCVCVSRVEFNVLHNQGYCKTILIVFTLISMQEAHSNKRIPVNQ